MNTSAAPENTRTHAARLSVWLALALLAATLSGCNGFQGERKAAIPEMAVTTRPPGCWVSFLFKQYPQGNAKDVRITLSSKALDGGSKSFDWRYIGARAVVKDATRKSGRRRAERVSADQKPPLSYPFKVWFPLRFRPQVGRDEKLRLTAELFWAGKSQDRKAHTLESLYSI